MKKITIFTCIIVMTLSLQSQVVRMFHYIKDENEIEIQVDRIDSITFEKFTVPHSSVGVLINGVTWATCNVESPGKFAPHPSAPGMFYQWNRRVGWSSKDPLANHEGGATWNNSTPTGNIWEKANDPCPTGWRVPTRNELQSLVTSGSFWGELNGEFGCFFGNGSQRAFFNAASYRIDAGQLIGWLDDPYGLYWSSTSFGSNYAYNLFFNNSYLMSGNSYAITEYIRRNWGFPVRCVAE